MCSLYVERETSSNWSVFEEFHTQSWIRVGVKLENVRIGMRLAWCVLLSGNDRLFATGNNVVCWLQAMSTKMEWTLGLCSAHSNKTYRPLCTVFILSGMCSAPPPPKSCHQNKM